MCITCAALPDQAFERSSEIDRDAQSIHRVSMPADVACRYRNLKRTLFSRILKNKETK
jgi:hypothetical protein